MIKLVVGKKGSGKTKMMLDAIAQAVQEENGNVLFVCNSARHMLEVTYEVRLVDVSNADTETFRLFKAFIMGIHIFSLIVYLKSFLTTWTALHALLKSLKKSAKNQMLSLQSA